MADEIKFSCEPLTKHWVDYSEKELHLYVLRNVKRTDCSFVVSDPKSENSNKVFKSFKWILKEMSPVLAEILNDKKSEAKNWNLIPISDPNFEIVVTYGHSKSFNKIFDNDIFDFYESAIKYQIGALKEHIYNFIGDKDFGTLNWINYIRVLGMETDPIFFDKMRTQFNEVFYVRTDPIHQNMESELKLESNIKRILDFDLETFYEFFDMMISICTTSKGPYSYDLINFYFNPLDCFQITEAYLIKHIFNGKAPDSPNELDNISRNIVRNFFTNFSFDKMTPEEFKNGPGMSKLLDKNTKERILNNIKK